MSTRTPHGAVVEARRPTRRSAVSSALASSTGYPAASSRAATASKAVSLVDLEAHVHGVVGRSRLEHDPLCLVVVAPGQRSGEWRRFPGHEADDVAEERRQRRGVGDLDAHVGELQLVPHVSVLLVQRPKSSDVTASAWASITSGSSGSTPESRRHSGASTNIVGPAPVTM